MSAAITTSAAATGPAPAGRGWHAPAIAPDVWLLAVSIAAGLGTARLTQAPGAVHVVGPITASVVAGHLAVSVARRLRVTVPVAMAAGVVVVVLATIWGQLASATRYGIPTPGTWRTLVSKFEAAGTVIRSHPTPVPATPEIVLCIATGAGLVAVLTRSVWARQEARGAGALPALLPTFGLFCYTALLSSQVDRLPGAIAYLASALAFVIVADRSTRTTLSAGGRAMLPAVLGAALAVIVPLAASPALATLKVDALPFGEPNGPGVLGVGLAPGDAGAGGGGLGANIGSGAFAGVRAIDLVDNLKAILVNRTTELMFDATTPVPTYWQVAVLTRFDGTTWSPDPTTQAAAQSDALSPPSRVPGLPALPEPQATKTFEAQVTIANLQSTLLPLPPTTVAVDADADFVPGFGGIQAIEAQPGLSYSAVARIPVNPAKAPPGTGSGGTPATGSVPASSLAPYLGLPAEPGPVVALAHHIVAGATGPAAQAAALARWFDTGRYRYTLSPPLPTGSNALESFLFTTRAGFCQQFAAAFGVLARIDGLPTRIAVGFTTGAGRGHQYRVTGADAHVWPEVYLGPSTGWTSYEPTPASSGEATGVGVNTGSRTSTQGAGARSTATTPSTVAPIRHPFSTNVPTGSTIPLKLHGKVVTITAPESAWRVALKITAASVAVLAVLVLVGLWVRSLVRNGWMDGAITRRRRRRRRPAGDPTAEVLAQWRDAARVLDQARLGKRPAETLEEHASRLRSLAQSKWLLPYRPVTDSSPGPDRSGAMAEASIEVSIDAYGKLSTLAARASYASDPCTSAEATDAELLGDLVRAGLSRPTGRRRVAVRS